MQTKEFVADLCKELDKIITDEKDLDLLTRIESYLAYKSLIRFLQNLANADTALTLRILQQCCDFIGSRWVGIRHTNSAYHMVQMSRANLFFRLFAQKLAKQLPLTAYQILMPSVAAIIYALSRKHLDDFLWQEFTLGDDGTPIEVVLCLDTAFENETLNLYHTALYNKPLSETERLRVIYHSEQTENYYNALEHYLATDFVTDLIQAQEELQAAIKSPAYQIKPAYGAAGEKKQAAYILSQIQTADEFVYLLENMMPRQKWGYFLNLVDTKDLHRLFLQDDSLVNSIQRRSLYDGNEGHDRTVIYCLTEILKRDVQDVETPSGLLGYFSWFNKQYIGQYRRFLTGFTNAEQQAAATLLQTFLLTNHQPYELNLFFTEKNITPAQQAPFKELGSPLSFLVEQLERIADVNYFREQPSSIWRLLGW